MPGRAGAAVADPHPRTNTGRSGETADGPCSPDRLRTATVAEAAAPGRALRGAERPDGSRPGAEPRTCTRTRKSDHDDKQRAGLLKRADVDGFATPPVWGKTPLPACPFGREGSRSVVRQNVMAAVVPEPTNAHRNHKAVYRLRCCPSAREQPQSRCPTSSRDQNSAPPLTGPRSDDTEPGPSASRALSGVSSWTSRCAMGAPRSSVMCTPQCGPAGERALSRPSSPRPVGRRRSFVIHRLRHGQSPT